MRRTGGCPQTAASPSDHFSFLHAARNFCRSLPCRPLASACLEHSTDFALRSLVAGALGAVAISAFAAPKLITSATQTGSRYFMSRLLGVVTHQSIMEPRRASTPLLHLIHRRQMQRRNVGKRHREALALEAGKPDRVGGGRTGRSRGLLQDRERRAAGERIDNDG